MARGQQLRDKPPADIPRCPGPAPR
jgi:hypothetical protein